MKNVTVDNVLSVVNTAPLPGTGMGGQMAHTYNYDGLYRLISATGTYAGANAKSASYSLEMAYDNLHNIVSKKQHVQQQGVQFDGVLKAGYDLTYNYADNPFQISTLKDENYRTEGDADKDKITSEHKYEYDANGNLIYVNTAREKQDGTNNAGSGEKKLVWDEENRLQSIYTNGFISGYWYDASGERVVKTSGDDEGVYVNDIFSGARTSTDNFTAYVSPYMVVSKGGSYTKHIYIGSQRIVSKLGDLDSYGQDPRRIEYAGANVDGASINYKAKYTASQQAIKDNYATFEVPYYGTDNDNYVDGKGFCCNDASQLRSGAIGNGNDNPEVFQYYYHSDHLGSSSLITNLDGDVVQHIEYMPFGEVFIEERNNTWNTPYLFNAKELDEETGLYYYGARYYDPKTSTWLSTDPMQEMNPNTSTYAYCTLNPVNYIDPDGQDWYWDSDGTRQFDPNVSSQKNLRDGQTYIGKTDAVKDKNGKIIENYRKDGSMVFSDQNSAYAKIWTDANKDKKEVFAVISNSSVTILPHYKNLEDKSYFKEYGYDFKDGNLQDPILNASKDVVATIHTHQSKGGFDSPSSTDADTFAQYTPYKPGLTMGGDGRLHGIYAFKNFSNKTVAEQINTLQMYSIKNITTDRNDLRSYLKQVYKQIIKGK